METLRTILIILHFIGLASLLGGILVQMKDVIKGKGKMLVSILHGAMTQLVTGLLLVATIEMAHLATLDNTKVGVKLLVAVLIVVLVFAYRKKKTMPKWVLPAIGILAVVNIIIAVTWK